jgi:hypothetical protein
MSNLDSVREAFGAEVRKPPTMVQSGGQPCCYILSTNNDIKVDDL